MARLWIVRAVVVARDVDNSGGGLRRTACKDVTMEDRAGRAAWTSSDWLIEEWQFYIATCPLLHDSW